MRNWRDRIIECPPPEGTPQHAAWLREKKRKSITRKLWAVGLLAALVWGLQKCADVGHGVTVEAERKAQAVPGR